MIPAVHALHKVYTAVTVPVPYQVGDIYERGVITVPKGVTDTLNGTKLPLYI